MAKLAYWLPLFALVGPARAQAPLASFGRAPAAAVLSRREAESETPPDVSALADAMAGSHDPVAVRIAVRSLSALALSAEEARPGLRREALAALSRAAGKAVWVDRDTEESVVVTALESLRRAASREDKMLSMMILHNYLEARGAGVIYRSPLLSRWLDSQLLKPLDTNPRSLYTDPLVNSDFRYFLIRSLRFIAGTREAGVPAERVRRILLRMARRDPEARFREIAQLYARG